MAINPQQLNLTALEQQHGLPAGLLQAVMKQESGGNPNAVSPAGAQGLFQFMPQTAKAYGVNPFDPQQSAVAAARMYGDLSKQFKGDVPSMLAAYNWGSGNVSQKGLQSAPKETKDYINKITGQLQLADAGNVQNDALPEGFEVQGEPPPEGFVIHEPEQKSPPTSLLKAFGLGGADMASFGLDDELRGVGRALGSKMKGDKRPFSELRNLGINELRSEHNQAEEDQTGAYRGGQVAGAVIPAFLAPGQALANWSRIGGPLARMAKRGGIGAASLGAYGMGSNEGDVLDRAKASGDDAALGATIGIAAPAVVSAAVGGSKNIVKGLKARAPEELQLTGEALRKQASNIYKEFKETGATLATPKVRSIVKSVNNSLTSVGKNNAELHRKTLSALDGLKADAKKGGMSLEELDQHRQLFSGILRDETDIAGKVSQDGLKASKAIDAINRAVKNIKSIDVIGGDTRSVQLLEKAKAGWAKQSRFDAISRIVDKAEGDPRKIKTMLSTFVRNKKNLNGFSGEEREALKKASRNSGGEAILNIIGKFGIDKNRIMAPLVGGGFAGATLGNPVGAALVGAGTVARQAQKYIAKGKMENVLRTIESRPDPTSLISPPSVPLIDAPESALIKFSKKFNRKITK